MTDSFSVLELFKKSSDFLSNKGIKSHKADAEWIFQEILQIKKIDIFLDQLIINVKEDLNKLREALIRRSKREPLQHIIGHVEFINCTIKADHRALIPRFETESLVEFLAERLPKDFDKEIYDFGTGSGAIIVALAKKYPSSRCIGFDKSKDALSLAMENVQINNCSQNTKIEHFDWTKETVSKKCNVLISNPPYLSLREWKQCETEVKEYDPKCALISDNEGKKDIDIIMSKIPETLERGGLMALEFGKGQCEYIVNRYEKMFLNLEIKKDLNGVRRFLIGEFGT